jgi:hypothetical protein
MWNNEDLESIEVKKMGLALIVVVVLFIYMIERG